MLTLTPKEYARLLAEPAPTSARNAANRQEGATFQARLDDYHAQLQATGRATVYRTNPDIRQTGPKSAVITGKGPVDYIAFLSTGRVVHFDAKSRAGKAFTVDSREAGHQLDWLATMQNYGHTAGLLVWWKDFNECRWHPLASFQKRVRLEAGHPLTGLAWLDLLDPPSVPSAPEWGPSGNEGPSVSSIQSQGEPTL